MPRKEPKTLLWGGQRYPADDPDSFPDAMQAAMEDKRLGIEARERGERGYKTSPELLARISPPKEEPVAASQPAQAKAPEAPVQVAEKSEATGLPADFPAEYALTKAGYKDLAAVMAAPDEDLLKLTGIGEKTLADIRKAQEST